MPNYSYSVQDKNNKRLKGILEAESEREARLKLKNSGLLVISIKTVASRDKRSKSVSQKQLILTTRQISLLLDSDTQVEESLRLAADQTVNKVMKESLYEIRDLVLEGKGLRQAFAEYPRIFNHTYLSLIQVGDHSGNLMLMFESLANYLEASLAIRRKVMAALVYPMIVLLFSIFSILLFFVVVLPKVVSQFEDAGVALPLITQIFISFSKWIPFLSLAAVLGGILAWLVLKFKPLNHIQKRNIDKKLLALPLLGHFLLLVELERFASLMSLYIQSGINFDIAFIDTSQTFSNQFLKHEFNQVVLQVREGVDFTVSLKNLSFCPLMFTEMLSSGYRSGNMKKAFSKLENFLKMEIENKRNLFLATLEPFIILLMGGLILVLVISIILPILKMNTLLLK